jgi:hypothetical protein
VDYMIDSVGCTDAVQGEGWINGHPFYFRSSGGYWSFSVAVTPDGISAARVDSMHPEEASTIASEYSAGRLTEEAAREFIAKGGAL